MNGFTIDAPNGPVAGIDTGDGPPVVLLAGLGSTVEIWGSLPTVLGRRLRVVAIDNRGVGGSRGGRPFTLDGAVGDLEAVLDALGIERTALLGASMGGAIALTAAATLPSRITRVVVASAAARLTTHGRRVLELLRDLLLYAPPDRVGAALMTLAFSPPFHQRFPGFVDETTTLFGLAEADLAGALAQVEHLLRGWDLRDDLATVDRPVLVLCGDRDPVVAPEDTAELAARLPRAELVRLPDAAHSVLAEGGRPILERVAAFLGDAG